MTSRFLLALIAVSCVVSCAPTPDAQSPADALSGRWSGEWGQDSSQRDPVSLELRWDGGSKVEGVVNPGRNGLTITKASYDKATGAISMEFDAFDDGRPVHFTIEGKVDGTTMTGTWKRQDRQGDFRLTRE